VIWPFPPRTAAQPQAQLPPLLQLTIGLTSSLSYVAPRVSGLPRSGTPNAWVGCAPGTGSSAGDESGVRRGAVVETGVAGATVVALHTVIGRLWDLRGTGWVPGLSPSGAGEADGRSTPLIQRSQRAPTSSEGHSRLILIHSIQPLRA
jgi:hypothetical protein